MEGQYEEDDDAEIVGIPGSGAEEEDLESDEENSEESEDEPWVIWFLRNRGNEYFCQVDEDFIADDFNLTGLDKEVPYYDAALDMVMDVEIDTCKLNCILFSRASSIYLICRKYS
jgi:hypothetical protein